MRRMSETRARAIVSALTREEKEALLEFLKQLEDNRQRHAGQAKHT